MRISAVEGDSTSTQQCSITSNHQNGLLAIEMQCYFQSDNVSNCCLITFDLQLIEAQNERGRSSKEKWSLPYMILYMGQHSNACTGQHYSWAHFLPGVQPAISINTNIQLPFSAADPAKIKGPFYCSKIWVGNHILDIQHQICRTGLYEACWLNIFIK